MLLVGACQLQHLWLKHRRLLTSGQVMLVFCTWLLPTNLLINSTHTQVDETYLPFWCLQVDVQSSASYARVSASDRCIVYQNMLQPPVASPPLKMLSPAQHTWQVGYWKPYWRYDIALKIYVRDYYTQWYTVHEQYEVISAWRALIHHHCICSCADRCTEPFQHLTTSSVLQATQCAGFKCCIRAPHSLAAGPPSLWGG
jgi:hypothetical protein